jgi:hypothetical protein
MFTPPCRQFALHDRVAVIDDNQNRTNDSGRGEGAPDDHECRARDNQLLTSPLVT